MPQQDILFIDRNVLESFCIPLYASDLHKKFQATCTHDKNIEKNWCFGYYSLLSYANNSTHRSTTKK